MSSFVKPKSDCSINANAIKLPNNDLATISNQASIVF